MLAAVPLQHGAHRQPGLAAHHAGLASASRMERSALIADAVWVFTDPRLMPMTEATCASLVSP
jgi:hypothetical protein